MKRAAVLGLALASCGGAKAPAPPTAAGPSCLGYQQVLDREQELAARNDASLARALADANLAAADYDVDSYDVSQDEAAGVDGWQVVEASGRRTLLSPSTLRACGVGNPWHLARDGRGGVFVLQIQPHPVGHQQLAICGCQVDVPITCGGAAPAPVRWRWTLPAGVDFQGPLSLVVDDESSERVFAGRGDGKPCPVPTAPP